MSDELLKRADEIALWVGTHWDGCWQQHDGCLAVRLAARVRELEAERDALLERREVLGDQLDKINDDLTSTIIERDALRALLRQARGYIHPETTWCYDAPEGWLEDRIDAALAGEKP